MAVNAQLVISRTVLSVVLIAAMAMGARAIFSDADSTPGFVLLIVGMVLLVVFDFLGWNPVFKRNRSN